MISGSSDLELFSSYLQREALTKIYTRYNDGTSFPWFCMTFFKILRAMSSKFVDYFFLNSFSSVSSSPPHCPHLCLETSHSSPKQYHILLKGSWSHVPLHMLPEYFLMRCCHCAPLRSKALHCALQDPCTPGSSVALSPSSKYNHEIQSSREFQTGSK